VSNWQPTNLGLRRSTPSQTKTDEIAPDQGEFSDRLLDLWADLPPDLSPVLLRRVHPDLPLELGDGVLEGLGPDLSPHLMEGLGRELRGI